MRRKLWLSISFLLALSLSIAGVALAQQGPQHRQAQDEATGEGVMDSALEAQAAHPGDHQHGGDDGHLLPTRKNVRLIGKAEADPIGEGRIADVGAFKNFAYLGAFAEPDCQNGGVYVFDIKDLEEPEQVGFIEAAEGSFVGEGVQVINVTTPDYRGDVLIHNNEICDFEASSPNGGVSLWDVSNPRDPQPLAEGVGDFDPDIEAIHTVHSAFAWDAGRKAYAVLVDNEESADVDIMDISDPENPEVIREYDLDAEFPRILQEDLGGTESFFHDVIVKKINGRQVMLLSYWDGGYVKLDVTDPENAAFIADSDFESPDPEAAESGLTVEPEGNAHEAEFSRDNRFIVAADEDFNPHGVVVNNTSEDTEFDAKQATDTPRIEEVGPLAGETVFVGRACGDITDPEVPAGGGSQIAVVERGACDFNDKVANIEEAGGYAGVIIINREGEDACSDPFTPFVEGGIPVVFVGRDAGYDLFDEEGYDEGSCREGDGSAQAPIEIGATGDEVEISAFFDGWGYVHLFRNGTDKLRELDTYAIPEAHDPRFAEDFGDLSVHEVAMSQRRNDLAYFSYYSGGFRVAKIQDGQLTEVGNFIDEDGNNLWGVQVIQRGGKEYVLASDRDFGLYVFRYTGRP